MLIRTWLYAVAFGIIFAGSVAAQEIDPMLEQQPVAESRQSDTTNNGDEAAQGNIATGPDILTAIERIESAIRDLVAEEDEIEANRQRQNESRDLNAQEAMAKWARWMFWATVGTAVITLVGLILIGFTLSYTRKAAEHTEGMLIQAERATAAAEGAVAATRDIGEKQVRAYLHVKTVSFCIGKKEGEVGATISVANAGQSPAIGVKVTIVFENDGKKPAILKIPMPNIAANSEQSRTVKPIKQDGTGIGLMGAKRVTAFVTVEAMDVFDQSIEAVSMRTIYIPGGARDGENFAPEDAEGYFPDAAVKYLAERHLGVDPNKEKSSKG